MAGTWAGQTETGESAYEKYCRTVAFGYATRIKLCNSREEKKKKQKYIAHRSNFADLNSFRWRSYKIDEGVVINVWPLTFAVFLLHSINANGKTCNYVHVPVLQRYEERWIFLEQHVYGSIRILMDTKIWLLRLSTWKIHWITDLSIERC